MPRRPAIITVPVVVAVLVRPWLWATALVQMHRLAGPGWWRRPPFLPLPPADYSEFRLVTQYGGKYLDEGGRVVAADVVDYLSWCRDWNRR